MKSAIHIIPMSGALVIVGFNLQQYYIGGELSGATGQDPEKLQALQFVAKLHELFMLASLGEVLFTWLRKELVFGNGLPFGAVFAGLQFKSLSTLWSPEFRAMVHDAWSAHRDRNRRKRLLAFLTIVCIMLGVSVGPSTANLMKPRLGEWPAGGTDFWLNITTDQLYPSSMSATSAFNSCSNDTGNASCPSGDYVTIAEGYMSFWPQLVALGDMPEELYLAGPYSMRCMEMRHRNQLGEAQPIWTNEFTTATVPPAGMSDALAELGRMWAFAAANADDSKRFRYRRDVVYSARMYQPVVMARCENITDTDLVAAGHLEFFDLSSLVSGTGGNKKLEAKYSRRYIWRNATAIALVNSTLSQATSPEVLWFDDQELLNSTGSTLVAIVVYESTAGVPGYYCCSIDSRHAPSTSLATRNRPKSVSGTQTDWINYGTYKGGWNRTYPSAPWAEYLFPAAYSDYGSETNAFARLMTAAGLFNSTLKSDPKNALYIIESILTTSIANGLGRVNWNAALIGALKKETNDPWAVAYEKNSWLEYFFSKDDQLGYGRNIFNVTQAEVANATHFAMRAQAYGYAYSSQGMVQKAQIAVLVVYILVAGFHLIISMSTGWTFTAWDNAPEIAALALNSQPSKAFENTGAGISVPGTFEKSVRVVERDGKLQMVFEDTSSSTDKSLRANEEYS